MPVLRILGLDPGLRKTGWGLIESEGSRLGYLACGTFSSQANEALALRLKSLFEALDGVIAHWHPHEVAVEETFVNRDAQATLKLGHARAICLLAPALKALPVAEYAPNVIKKSVVGAGHAEKGQVGAMVRILLPKAAPETSDASDALAIAITHAHWRQNSLKRG
jgi:crossover junction endodeoxyribonuclease RuvC